MTKPWETIAREPATTVGVPLLIDAASRPTVFATNGPELIAGETLTVLGGALLVSWPLAFIHTPMERLDTRVRGMALEPASERLAHIEKAVAAAAATERKTRQLEALVGFVYAALSAALIPVGLVSTEQSLAYIGGATCIGGIVLGSVALTTWGPIERMWRTWRVGTGRPAARVRIVPSVGGLRAQF